MDVSILHERQVIGGGRRRGGCFRCGSSDRERLVHAYLTDVSQALQRASSLHVLHIAPEAGLTRFLLGAGLAEYACGDLFMPGYRYAAHVRSMNVLALPFPDRSFDWVICNHVLEHVHDDRAAMRELRRVLKPDGRAILQVPLSKNSAATVEDPSLTDPVQRERQFGQSDHLRIYGQDYPQRLEACGFQVQRVSIAARYPGRGLLADEDLFLCSARHP